MKWVNWQLITHYLQVLIKWKYFMPPRSVVQMILKRQLKFTEAVVQRCSVKKVFLEISQNSQKNICARVSFFQLCEISKSTFFGRAPLVVAFGFYKVAIIFFTL